MEGLDHPHEFLETGTDDDFQEVTEASSGAHLRTITGIPLGPHALSGFRLEVIEISLKLHSKWGN